MEWQHNIVQNEYDLMSGSTKIAAIQIRAIEKSEKIKVKTIVDAIYYGEKIQLSMEKQNKDWICYRKKLKKEDVDRYVAVKKSSVFKFISAREKEA